MSSFIAAGTAYATHGVNTIPFFIFYSMFGFQRIGDLIWAAADSRTRGFLLGGTAGRTTLAGEGLQHQDGNSQLLALPVPNCVSYDPAFAYEIAVIIQDGIRRMYVDQESIFYYLTVMNEQYAMPAMPEGARDGILKGLYRFQRDRRSRRRRLRAQLFGSGAILPEVIKAQEILESKYDVGADVWSVTSYSELYRDGHACERWNMLHPGEPPRVPYVTQCLKDAPGVFVAASDYVKALPDSIDRWLPRPLAALGTDGFGRSENRASAARLLRGRLPLRHRRHAGGAGARRQDRRVGRGAGDQGAQHQSGESQPGDFVADSTAGHHDGQTPRWRVILAVARSVVEILNLATDFTLPELGENITAGDVLRVLVKPGDTLAKDQPVLELETDKATIEVPSSVAGTVKDSQGQGRRQGQGRPGDPQRRCGRRRCGAAAAPSRSRRHAAAEAPAARREHRREGGRATSRVRAARAKDKRPTAGDKPGVNRQAGAAGPGRRPPGAAGRAGRRHQPRRAARPTPKPRRAGAPPAPAAPSVRRMARELGVDINEVAGQRPEAAAFRSTT